MLPPCEKAIRRSADNQKKINKRSMKVPANTRQPTQQIRHIHQPLRDEMSNLALALPRAIHRQQRRTERLSSLLFQQTRPYDHVNVASLILQRNEHHALRSTRPLTHGHESTTACEPAVPVTPQRGGRHQPMLKQRRPQQFERMTSER